MRIVSYEEADPHLDWIELTDALAHGHALAAPEIGDTFLYRGSDTLLNRSAWIDGLGAAVKVATVLPGNPESGRPMIHGGVMVFDDQTGELTAIVDFQLVTKWKTAADSLLAARRLARPETERILIIGAGTVARNMISAYRALFPKARFEIWNRSAERARALAEDVGAEAIQDLPNAVGTADLICCATMSSEPVLQGGWLRPGQHVDLIGAYRPDMREADDTALTRAKVFVDSFDTTIGHIGEIEDPLRRGIIRRADILADFRNLDAFRRAPGDITLCKNGGGAHLDLMTARYILSKLGG